MSSQGIQGQDIIPREVWNSFKDVFTRYLPGWQTSGIYNYNATTSTQMASVQLNKLLHSGSHPWINDALKTLLARSEFVNASVAEKTLKLSQLVNYLTEAQNLNGAKTGGFVAWANRTDPHLIKSLGFQPSVDYMRSYTNSNLT